MASQKTSQSSSSSGSSLELQQHQPSFDQQQRGSNGSFADQPGPSGLQAGPSGLQVCISKIIVEPLLKDAPNKGHLSIKDKFCGPWKFYLLK